jgi:hypothetical protein
MDIKINQADKLMRQNGAIQTSKTNSWTLRGIKYFFNKHGIFFSQKYSSTIGRNYFMLWLIRLLSYGCILFLFIGQIREFNHDVNCRTSSCCGHP